MIKNFLLVGAGGAIGTMLRYSAGLIAPAKLFPVTTLLINVIGSFVIGLIVAISMKSESFDPGWKLFIAVGICGGFTTFSAFSLENLQLLQQKKILMFALYTAGSVVSGILAAWLGFKLGTSA